MQKSKLRHWLKLANIEIDKTGDGTHDAIARVNDNQFIMVPSEWDADHQKQMQIYNIHTNQWNNYKIQSPHLMIIYCHGIVYDEIDEKLYLSGTDCSMAIVDINTKQCQSYSQTHGYEIYDPSLVDTGTEIHIIEHDKYPSHVIFDKKTKLFSKPNYFFGEDKYCLGHQSAIYSSKLDTIFLFVPDYPFTTWPKKPPSGLYTYSITNRKWNYIQTVHFGYHTYYSAILLPDEQNIIISAANVFKKDCKSNIIYVLNISDINNYKLYQSSIQLPVFSSKNTFEIVQTGNMPKAEILISAWIRNAFKSENFNDLQLPPHYIIILIREFYTQEEIHWITESTTTQNEHYVINIKHILRNRIQS